MVIYAFSFLVELVDRHHHTPSITSSKLFQDGAEAWRNSAWPRYRWWCRLCLAVDSWQTVDACWFFQIHGISTWCSWSENRWVLCAVRLLTAVQWAAITYQDTCNSDINICQGISADHFFVSNNCCCFTACPNLFRAPPGLEAPHALGPTSCPCTRHFQHHLPPSLKRHINSSANRDYNDYTCYKQVWPRFAPLLCG